ncbi:MAG: hypothetical protein AB3N23_22550 [Paracoccaceae bacterium]
MELGESVKFKGYVTQQHLVIKKSGEQIEKMMAYKGLRRGFGYVLLHLKQMPGPRDFVLDGEGGGQIDESKLINPLDQKTAKMRLDDWDKEWEVLREMVINDTFAIAGARRLVKVLPNKQISGNRDYPPTGKLLKWTLTKKMKFKVAAIIPPEGGRWQMMGKDDE